MIHIELRRVKSGYGEGGGAQMNFSIPSATWQTP